MLSHWPFARLKAAQKALYNGRIDEAYEAYDQARRKTNNDPEKVAELEKEWMEARDQAKEYVVANEFTKRGWFAGGIKKPLGMHQAVNPLHAPVVDRFLADLAACVESARQSGARTEFNEHSY